MPVPVTAGRVAPEMGAQQAIGTRRGGAVPDFREVYRNYVGFIWACTRRMGVSEDEIDDVVQEVFIVINAKLETLEQPESLRSWIYGIIRRTVSTYRRARRAKAASAEALISESEMQYPQPPSPQELAEQSDQVKLLWQLLVKLDAPKREVFVLAELDEMTVPGIAAAIEVPVNTVYSRLRTARQELETALTKHLAQTGQRGRP
ncbi:MAG: sigma-70 family RNA polymerase sigma factor [Polyangiaceae bacterium]